MPVTKKYYDNGVAHPAVYSNALLPIFADVIRKHFDSYERPIKLLDPFAGVGRIHELRSVCADRWALPVKTFGVEIEPEWAELHPFTLCSDIFDFAKNTRRRFHAIVTSPTYGNRMADHHDAKDASLRRSYKHDLGRDLHPNNSGQMHWGPEYRDFHARAWEAVANLLEPPELFVLNCKNHIRGGIEQKVCQWHLATLRDLGFKRLETIPVGTPSMRAGENRDLRCREYVYVLRGDA